MRSMQSSPTGSAQAFKIPKVRLAHAMGTHTAGRRRRVIDSIRQVLAMRLHSQLGATARNLALKTGRRLGLLCGWIWCITWSAQSEHAYWACTLPFRHLCQHVQPACRHAQQGVSNTDDALKS